MSVYQQMADNARLLALQQARQNGFIVTAQYEMRVGLPIKHRLELCYQGAKLMTWLTDDRAGLRRAFDELQDCIKSRTHA